MMGKNMSAANFWKLYAMTEEATKIVEYLTREVGGAWKHRKEPKAAFTSQKMPKVIIEGEVDGAKIEFELREDRNLKVFSPIPNEKISLEERRFMAKRSVGYWDLLPTVRVVLGVGERGEALRFGEILHPRVMLHARVVILEAQEWWKDLGYELKVAVYEPPTLPMNLDFTHVHSLDKERTIMGEILGMRNGDVVFSVKPLENGEWMFEGFDRTLYACTFEGLHTPMKGVLTK